MPSTLSKQFLPSSTSHTHTHIPNSSAFTPSSLTITTFDTIMAPSTVLGKRTRSSTATTTVDSSPSRKRQARVEVAIPILNDENEDDENPFITRKRHTKAHDGNCMESDDDLKAIITKRPTPTKDSARQRIALSPAKSKSIHNATQDENLQRVQSFTPQTPRHRDAFAKPATPRHRVTLAGKPLTPRTPRTPYTPGGSLCTVYSQARLLFTRSSEPGRLIGREAEREELSGFVQGCIETTSGGCTYVSGPPGTGKSAMVGEVTETFAPSDTLQKAYINCMSIKSSKDLCGNLLENLCPDIEILEGDEIEALQGMFVTRKKTSNVYVVTLDEIDHILTLDLEIMYKLFEWSLQKSSRLILIGIANALDLTDRFLPRLKARNLKPHLLPFLPYNAAQIKTVITTRLKSLVPKDSPTPDFVPFMHPAAIELCSRKVSSQTGDLRKAFDICRRAIDVIEAETKQKHEQALQEQALLESPSKRALNNIENLALPPTQSRGLTLSQSLAKLTIETAPRAMISHLNKITSATFNNGANQRLKALNLQQKAALCALVALEKRKREVASNVLSTPSKSRVAAPTIKALYDVYCMLCKRDSILHPLTSTEFRDVIGSLETLSLVSAVDGRNGSFVGLSTPSKRARKFGGGIGVGDEKRVGSCVGEKEVATAVEGLGAGILKSILNGEGLE